MKKKKDLEGLIFFETVLIWSFQLFPHPLEIWRRQKKKRNSMAVLVWLIQQVKKKGWKPSVKRWK